MICHLRSGPPPHILLDDGVMQWQRVYVTFADDHPIRRAAGGSRMDEMKDLPKGSTAEAGLKIQTRLPRPLVSTGPPCVSSRHGPSSPLRPRGSLVQHQGLVPAWACPADWTCSELRGNHLHPLKPKVSQVRGCPAVAALARSARVGCWSLATSVKVHHIGPPRPGLWRSLHPLDVVWRAGLA